MSVVDGQAQQAHVRGAINQGGLVVSVRAAPRSDSNRQRVPIEADCLRGGRRRRRKTSRSGLFTDRLFTG